MSSSIGEPQRFADAKGGAGVFNAYPRALGTIGEIHGKHQVRKEVNHGGVPGPSPRAAVRFQNGGKAGFRLPAITVLLRLLIPRTMAHGVSFPVTVADRAGFSPASFCPCGHGSPSLIEYDIGGKEELSREEVVLYGFIYLFLSYFI